MQQTPTIPGALGQPSQPTEQPQTPPQEEPQIGASGAIQTENGWKCPDCGVEFPTAQGVSRHRVVRHGYKSPHRAHKKKGSEKAGAATGRKTRQTRQRISPERHEFDQNRALKLLYPDGIPADASVLTRLAAWLEEGSTLSKMR